MILFPAELSHYKLHRKPHKIVTDNSVTAVFPCVVHHEERGCINETNYHYSIISPQFRVSMVHFHDCLLYIMPVMKKCLIQIIFMYKSYKPDQNCERLYSEILASCKLQLQLPPQTAVLHNSFSELAEKSK